MEYKWDWRKDPGARVDTIENKIFDLLENRRYFCDKNEEKYATFGESNKIEINNYIIYKQFQNNCIIDITIKITIVLGRQWQIIENILKHNMKKTALISRKLYTV